MLGILIVLGYVACIIGFCVWDAVIGFGPEYKWDGFNQPPLALAAVFWPIAVPFVAIDCFIDYMGNVKKRRLAREAKQARLRIAAEKELQAAMDQVEEEIQYEQAKGAYKG